MLAALGPIISSSAHSRLAANSFQQLQLRQCEDSQAALLPLSAGSVAVVAESLKLLVAAATLLATQDGTEPQEAIMQVGAGLSCWLCHYVAGEGNLGDTMIGMLLSR